MTINVGTFDRILRAAHGRGRVCHALLSGIPAVEAERKEYGAAAIGVIMLIVATTRVCPIYSIFGFRTCRA